MVLLFAQEPKFMLSVVEHWREGQHESSHHSECSKAPSAMRKLTTGANDGKLHLLP